MDELINALSENAENIQPIGFKNSVFKEMSDDIDNHIKSQTDELRAKINQNTEEIGALKPVIQKAGEDTLFSKVTAIISILIALTALGVAVASLGLQLGWLRL